MSKYKNKRNINTSEKPIRKLRIDDLKVISPKTPNQQKTFEAFKANKELVLHGVAGTGKSYISLYLALEQVLDYTTDYSNVIIVRSVVPTRDIGFLPGTEAEKIAIYEAPYRYICEELFGIKNAYECLKATRSIEFTSTSHIRGRTINNSIIIVDEMQNLTFHELDSIFTRIGQGTRIIFCGDYLQSDLTKTADKQGILKFMNVLGSMRETAQIEFGVDDIVRSDIIKSYILAKLRLNIT
jgi:phosphate starvation-inducible protein PhoH and related proteins